MAKILKFPKSFLWGSATSAYQVEGGIENCDWAKIHSASKTCDHYNQYEKDFDLAESLNQNAHRFSIEWSRVEPEEGKFNKKEIEHYRNVLLALKERNIKSFVTLWHWTSPLWLAETGGWTNKKVIFYFSRFAKRVFEEYQDLVDFWITINEPLVYTEAGCFAGVGPPQKKNLILFFKVLQNLIKAHKKVYEVFKKTEHSAKVGISKHNSCFDPFSLRSPLDRLSTLAYRYFWNKYFLDRIKNHQDFIALNYYNHFKIKFPFSRLRMGEIVSDIGWEIYPQGISPLLKELQKYRVPIYVTENGLADAKDRLRKNFIKDHLFWIHKAIEEEVDVRGYLHWSLMDNCEWDQGTKPRFGLIEIDYKTLERKVRPSAFYYARICKENVLEY